MVAFVVTTMSIAPSDSDAGDTAVIEVSELTVKEVASVPPKDTEEAPVNPEPVMFTVDPPASEPLALPDGVVTLVIPGAMVVKG